MKTTYPLPRGKPGGGSRLLSSNPVSHSSPREQSTQQPPLLEQPPRAHILDAGSSARGLKIFKQLLTPNEEACLKNSRASAKLFEGSNKLLEVAHLLISAFKEVAGAATTSGKRARFFQENQERLQKELARARAAHEEEVAKLRATLDKGQEDITEGLVREERLQDSLSISESSLRSISEQAELQLQRAKLAENALALAEYNKDKWQASFLQSPEFKKAVVDKACPLFQTGFEKCREQYEEAGLLPQDKENFPDFGLAIASLPKDGEEEKEATQEEQPGPEHVDID
uniref:uncharacterized protein LOC142554728 n=1 Tax=Primulina tabacum TaxID=48773 RepID=UPI003F5929BF